MIKSYSKNGKKHYEVYVSGRDKAKKIVARRKRNIASEREAREVELQFRIELSHLLNSNPIWSWSKWHREAVRQMSLTYKKSTVMNYEGRITKWLPEDWKDRDLESFTRSDILNVLESIGQKSETVSKKFYLKLLSRIFQMAVENGHLEKNPAEGIRLKHDKPVQKVLNSKEVEILLNEARNNRHRFYEIWVVALMTGMRSGELFALLWSDVDFETGLIKVNKQWTNKDGITPTKTGESRVVPISNDLERFLREMSLRKTSNSDPVLPRLKEWEGGFQAEVLKDFCKVIGITPVKFHDLRATFITNMLAQGVPLVKVMSIVGHRKMATTDGYLRLAGVEVQGTTDKIGYSLPSSAEGEVLPFVRKN